ncbi:nibrin-like [Stegodyphus dumicola]|uniref:nibrin-like n=1 Tax=Stegodyphus dumicola TaxID=202533 RepID=UPI0015AA6FFA|nr:nibrin-like [Stegodyphus dumicola]
MLKIIVHNLGGHFVPEWQPSCTHLVMSEVKVTVKALCCLVSAKPIVQPEYFEELKKSLHSTSTVISPNNFVPPIGESLIDQDKVSFGVNLQRKQIFENRTFFFLDEKQFKKLHLGIILGSGNATILSDEEIDEELLLRDGHCVIEPSREMSQNAEINKLMEQVKSILLKKKLRMIPESDIGLAVAYCSTEKYCNPKFSFGAAVLRSPKVQSQTLSQGEVYVPNTEELVAG